MLGEIQRRPGFLLRRAHQISVALFEHHCKALNLTPAQYGVLRVAKEVSPVDQATLSRFLGLDKVTILHVVRALQGRGLLSRTASPTDARKLDITLTPEGMALLDQATPMAEHASRQLLTPLTPEQKAEFLNLLDIICSDLEAFARAPLERLPV